MTKTCLILLATAFLSACGLTPNTQARIPASGVTSTGGGGQQQLGNQPSALSMYR